MKLAQVRSRCECQARLFAELDDKGRVVHGSLKHGEGPQEQAPAIGIHVDSDQFQVGWLCNVCGRNTVRSFFKGALQYREVAHQEAATA